MSASDEPIPVFPVFFDLRGRLCLVVGGGEAAADKAALLLRCGARLRVVAPTLSPRFAAWCAEGRCELRATSFRPSHLRQVSLVIAAAGPAIDARVSQAAQAIMLPVNVVDRPDLCSFIMPAIIDRAPLVVAISTGGAAPLLARLLRERLERMIPPGWGRLAGLARRFRPLVRAELEDSARRRSFWTTVLTGRTARLVEIGEEEAAAAELRRELAHAIARSP